MDSAEVHDFLGGWGGWGDLLVLKWGSLILMNLNTEVCMRSTRQHLRTVLAYVWR